MRDIKKVLILGSAALKIGEAGEFDYSGSQAIKALKQEGIETILVNPNIATIQTSDHLADKVYLLPVKPDFIEEVIKKEKPDGIYLSFGGQTALNCGLELAESGVLDKYNVTVLGTPIEVIKATEDRDLFVKKLAQIDVDTPKSKAVGSTKEAMKVAEKLGYPVMVRIAYALGGLGSGVCRNEEELRELANKAFSYTSQILIEESLQGWKEIEYEVLRDSFDNCVTVCNMENFDPLGIHTGESIVVAPSQTLNNYEYHYLREISIKVIRHLGIIGECNIQYAFSPDSDEYRVIEVNARLSRSSALASKATGYPLAFVASQLGLGYSLTELKNSVTLSTMACFEPALDYIVVKIPRWDLKKFKKVSRKLGSSMKSVGEVMGIGRSFPEALQKALRMLEIGSDGIVANSSRFGYSEGKEELIEKLKNPTESRIYSIVHAFKSGMKLEEIGRHTSISPWFLHQIYNILEVEKSLKVYAGGLCPKDILLEAKKHGFSDKQIARILESDETSIRNIRKNYDLHPSVKQIDTLAGEYQAQTNYLYLTYHGTEDDISYGGKKSIIVLGSGTYRIGSSVEFDWCGVNAVKTLRKNNYNAVMINYNPETVSTDYDEVDRLYFDEISLENILEIYSKEEGLGVIVSMGGQTPNNLALPLERFGVNILGTKPEKIDMAENRYKFSAMLDRLGIDQPAWKELTSVEEAREFCRQASYPVLVRPSYVLSGSAMGTASNDEELNDFLARAADVSKDNPVVISKFIENAKEIEFDGVADKGEVLISAISEHVENAGVHSGDATLVTPPQRTYLETMRRVKKIAHAIAGQLEITGPFNIQFIAKSNHIKVIECNLRASRSFPFVSKVYKHNFIEIAVEALLGLSPGNNRQIMMDQDHVGVKASHFSFTRLLGADPVLGVEMASTGEVGCIGDDFQEALLKAMISVGFSMKLNKVLLLIGGLENRLEFLDQVKALNNMGTKIFVSKGCHELFSKYNLECSYLENDKDILDLVESKTLSLIINVSTFAGKEKHSDDYKIRRKAVDFNVPLVTNLQLAQRFIDACSVKSFKDLKIIAWNEYK